MKFTKWQGCGNDFLVVDSLEDALPQNPGALAKKLCDRHYGVGGDGLIFALGSDKADFCMRIFNADGSEAEMCGNGIRCFARYLFDFKRTEKTTFTVETGAGILTPEILLEGGKVSAVSVDMGEPELRGDKIPVTGFGEGKVIHEPINVLDETLYMTCVSMGNPHAVFFVEDIKKCDIERLGPILEKHPCFPRKTNVEFVQAVSPQHLIMRVWERGAAITLACGTGSCASLVAGFLNKKCAKEAKIELDGGALTVKWASDNHLYMTGPAELVYQGEVA